MYFEKGELIDIIKPTFTPELQKIEKDKESADRHLRDIVLELPEFRNGDPIVVMALLENPEYEEGRKYAFVRGLKRFNVDHVYSWFRNQARKKNGLLIRLESLSAIRMNTQNGGTSIENREYRAVYRRRNTWE